MKRKNNMKIGVKQEVKRDNEKLELMRLDLKKKIKPKLWHVPFFDPLSVREVRFPRKSEISVGGLDELFLNYGEFQLKKGPFFALSSQD